MPTETGDGCTEWSRYYHDHELHGLDVLHARFIEHRYARHAHNYFVVALVETGAASCWYRGAQRAASAGQVFVINPDEPHTGDPATPSGYVYRVLYPRAEHVATVAADIGTTKNAIFFKESVLHDPRLAILLTDFHKHFALRASAAECESLLLAALERLIICHSDPRIMPRPVGRERPPVRTACEYIQAHFADDVSLSKLAALVSLSPLLCAGVREGDWPSTPCLSGNRADSQGPRISGPGPYGRLCRAFGWLCRPKPSYAPLQEISGDHAGTVRPREQVSTRRK